MSKENLKLPSEILEPSILIHSLKNKSFFLMIKPYLNTNGKKGKSYFNDEKNQFIFNVICKWYDKFFTFPTKKELTIINEKSNKTDEEFRMLIDSIINKIYDEDAEKDVSLEYVETETKSFIQESRVYEALMMSQIDVSEGNFTQVAERMKEAIAVNFDKDLGVSIRDIDTTLKLLEELASEKTISTGIPSLDTALDGGWRGKEIYFFAATPGIGKCIFSDVKVMISYEIDDKTGEII